MRRPLFVCLFLAAAIAAPALAPPGAYAQGAPAAAPRQRDFDFYARGPYRDAVPRPEALLGYPLGSRETTYWQQERVIRAIADAAPDRVRVVPYGESVEGRPLRVAVVSAPENMARLEEIRAQNLRLADPRGLAQADADRITASLPVIVWINENVHGDESTSFESGMQLVYQLAASEEPRTLELLRQAVVIVNPSFNPDGHERFAVYHNSVGMNDPNNDAYEHGQPWATHGRFNHYRFDMNRDKLAVSQPEVRQEIAEYLRWHPHVYVDQHGETDQYFFPPVALPINANVDLGLQERWLDVFGRANAASFDRFGWDYFNRKTYDFFYVGYLDIWSALNGAVGMTYETDGGGNRGFSWRRDDGTVITLRDGIARHFTTAMATIDAAVAQREAKLRDYVAFRRAAVDEGRTGQMKSVVILPGKDPARAAHLVANLRRVGVEVGVAPAEFASKAAHDYAGGAAAPRRFEAGAYVVDLAQPQGRLARAYLEPEAELNPEFVKDELAKQGRNRQRGDGTPHEGAGFYDVTAWSLPYAFGLEAYWTEDPPPSGLTPVGAPADPEGGLRPALAPEGRVTGGRGTAAFLFSYESDASARLALQLMREGFRLAVSPYPLKAGGRQFPRGTFVARTGRNPDTLASRVAALARQTGVEVFAVDSQYAEEATTGVGSQELTSLEAPRVLVAAGDPVSTTAFGAIWYLFEREFPYPFTAMDVEVIAGTDLSKFNVVVLPDGSAGAYAKALGQGGVERLRQWVNQGGTLVGMGGGAAFLAGKDVKMTTARAVGDDEDAKPPAAESVTDKPREADSAPGAEAEEEEPDTEPLAVPGAIFRANVSRNYFMSYGYDAPTLAVLVNSDLFLRPSEEGANVVTFGPDMKRLSGFVWPGNTERLLEGTAYVIDEPTGGGHVILFAEDVLFRRLWHSANRLFLNAVILAPGH
jgi:hypothetical protein